MFRLPYIVPQDKAFIKYNKMNEEKNKIVNIYQTIIQFKISGSIGI